MEREEIVDAAEMEICRFQDGSRGLQKEYPNISRPRCSRKRLQIQSGSRQTTGAENTDESENVRIVQKSGDRDCSGTESTGDA